MSPRNPTDPRRRPWIAVSVDVGLDAFGDRLQERFGLAGIGAWVLLLAAAKKSPVEGQVTFASDEEFWRLLGLRDPPGFSPSAFLSTTGQFHQTARRRRGRLTDVSIPQWGGLQRWRDGSRPEVGGSSTPKKAKPERTNTWRERNESGWNTAADLDRNQDQDKDSDPSLAPDRAREEVTDALLYVCGWAKSEITERVRAELALAAGELTLVGATASDVHRRARNYHDRCADMVLTPAALASQWAALATEDPEPVVPETLGEKPCQGTQSSHLNGKP